MRNCTKSLALSFCMFVFLGTANLASADPEIETIFNWAENNFAELFPSHQTTQVIEPWTFRHYPSTEIYVGAKDNEIFVLGGPWGQNPTFIDSVPNLITQIAVSGGNGSIPGCNTANSPSGMKFTQNGNVIHITTNGQCIPLPENTNFCVLPAPSAPTGVSLLRSANITSSEIKGVAMEIPGVLDSSVFADNNQCTINVSTEAIDQIESKDICLDITEQVSPFSALLELDPPVTIAFVGTTTNQIVPDCFATNAATVSDAFTGESWKRGADGSFIQIDF